MITDKQQKTVKRETEEVIKKILFQIMPNTTKDTLLFKLLCSDF